MPVDNSILQGTLDALRREWVKPYADALATFAQHDEACMAERREMYDPSVCEVCRLLERAESEGVLP